MGAETPIPNWLGTPIDCFRPLALASTSMSFVSELLTSRSVLGPSHWSKSGGTLSSRILQALQLPNPLPNLSTTMSKMHSTRMSVANQTDKSPLQGVGTASYAINKVSEAHITFSLQFESWTNLRLQPCSQGFNSNWNHYVFMGPFLVFFNHLLLSLFCCLPSWGVVLKNC